MKTTKEKKENSKKKVLTGTVISDKMEKTVIVNTKRYVKHPRSGKYVTFNKKYKAENPENKYKVGDTVIIESCRPISKTKSFRVIGLALDNKN